MAASKKPYDADGSPAEDLVRARVDKQVGFANQTEQMGTIDKG